MRRVILFAIVLAAVMPAGKPVGAWLLYPDRQDPEKWIVEIERPYGDVVALRSSPLSTKDIYLLVNQRFPCDFWVRCEGDQDV